MIANRSYTVSAQRCVSVYGGAGGRGTRIAQACYKPAHDLYQAEVLDLYIGSNEKTAMQNLNDRLASYMKQVHSLETENTRLEQQIKEWYQKRTVTSHDYSSCFATVSDLEEKIRLATKTNAKICIDTDNAELAADDFKKRYGSELAVRMTVEADIVRLKRIFDDVNLAKISQEQEYESFREELILLKKSHEEELALMRSQTGCQVNVSVDSAPSTNLNKAITEIREKYDSIIDNNHKKLEAWYNKKIAEVEEEVLTQTEVLTTTHTEIKDIRANCKKLEIELQTHISMKDSQESTLEEIQAQYADQLAGLESTIASLEDQGSYITDLINKYELQYHELEKEIKEYKRLLDGEEHAILIPEQECISKKHVITKVTTVVETVVNGRVVDSTESVDVNETDS